jgi:acyl-CoA thioesterase-1
MNCPTTRLFLHVLVALSAGLIIPLTTVSPTSAAPIDIVAIGASRTAGYGVGIDAAWPAQLEAMLRSKGYDVHIRNEGVSGAISSSMIGWADSVPSDTQLVLLDIAYSNDSRHFLTITQSEANRATIAAHLQARHIRLLSVDTHHLSVEDIGIATRGHPSEAGQRKIAARALPQVMAALGSVRR